MAEESYPFNALMILFPQFNTLDVNGPLEVFRKSGTSKQFKVTLAAEHDITVSSEGARMQRQLHLNDNLINNLDEYDLLIVPGGGSDAVMAEANRDGSLFMKLIKAFHSLAAIPNAKHPRILLSICTGALFPSKIGIFNGGRFCTTHHGIYDKLQEWNATAATQSVPASKPGIVLAARYVDSGLHEDRIQIISSGGISCGIDASLHVVSLRAGRAEALDTANMLDYAWRYTDGVTFPPLPDMED